MEGTDIRKEGTGIITLQHVSIFSEIYCLVREDMDKFIDKVIIYVPIVILLVIVIGYLVSEWYETFPASQLRSFMVLGQDKHIKVLG